MSPISANSGEYKSGIGLDSLYIAEVTVDSASAYTADTPEYLAPAAVATQEPTTSQETQHADDAPYDVITGEGETKITLEVTGLPTQMLAKITGKTFDAASGRMFDDEGTPPDMALSFRSLKSNGAYRYYQYLKGKFTKPSEETSTKTDSPTPKTMKLVYTAIKTTYPFDVGATNEKCTKVSGDTDTTNFSATGWFGQVQTPVAVAFSALALSSSVPTDGATAVVVTADCSLTFNNALKDDAIERVVMSKADGTVVAKVETLDATKKIITINPDASLTAATVYLITYAVTDIYGQHLQGVINFTTA